MNRCEFAERTGGRLPAAAPLFFIVNPAASGGKALAVWERVSTWLEKENVPYSYAVSLDADHVEALARVAAQSSGAVVAGVGGDGTLSRIATGLAGTNAALGVIPAGTGNDFARTFGFPADPEAACRNLLDGETAFIDIGRLNGRLFINVAGAGLDAEVAADANRIFKRLSGSLGYLLALVKQVITFRPRTIRMVVDDQAFTVKAWLVTVANARYYGSGMMVAPQADPQDGLADVVIVQDIHRLRFLCLFPRVYRGSHIAHPAVRVLRGRDIKITSDGMLHVHADGEIYGQSPLHVTIEHCGLRLILPRGKNKSIAPGEEYR